MLSCRCAGVVNLVAWSGAIQHVAQWKGHVASGRALRDFLQGVSGFGQECCPVPGQDSFYPVLQLHCLLCDWLVSRACRGGQVNNYGLVSW
jgi:hypothetical protein